MEKHKKTSMYQRINITLPKDTIELLNKAAGKGDRSGLVDRAVRQYVSKAGRAELRRLLKEGAMANAQRSLETAREWFFLGGDTWPKE